MTLTDFSSAWIRQCASALAWFSGIACVVERLSPGLVTADFGRWIYLIIFFAVLLTFVSPPPANPRRGWKVFASWLPIGFLLASFLWLVTSEGGRAGTVLSFAGSVLILGFLAAIAWPND